MSFLKQFGLKNIKLKKARRQLYPATIENEYERYLLSLVNFIYTDIRSKLNSEQIKTGIRELRNIRKTDDISDEVANFVNASRISTDRIYDERLIEDTTSNFSNLISDYNRKEVRKVIASIATVDIFVSEPWLLDELNIFVKNNVSLIKSIPNKFFDEIENMTFRTFREGLRHELLMKELRNRYLITRKRAKIIARDQVGKLNGQLTKLRQQSLGIRQYIWHNVGDRRVRGNPAGIYPKAKPSHWDREGQIFSWKKPPEGGHPGEAVLCRCWSEPVIK